MTDILEAMPDELQRRLGLLSDEEAKKVHDFFRYVFGAYYRYWFGKPVFDHKGVEEDLKKAKRILDELGI